MDHFLDSIRTLKKLNKSGKYILCYNKDVGIFCFFEYENMEHINKDRIDILWMPEGDKEKKELPKSYRYVSNWKFCKRCDSPNECQTLVCKDEENQ